MGAQRAQEQVIRVGGLRVPINGDTLRRKLPKSWDWDFGSLRRRRRREQTETATNDNSPAPSITSAWSHTILVPATDRSSLRFNHPIPAAKGCALEEVSPDKVKPLARPCGRRGAITTEKAIFSTLRGHVAPKKKMSWETWSCLTAFLICQQPWLLDHQTVNYAQCTLQQLCTSGCTLLELLLAAVRRAARASGHVAPAATGSCCYSSRGTLIDRVCGQPRPANCACSHSNSPFGCV